MSWKTDMSRRGFIKAAGAITMATAFAAPLVAKADEVDWDLETDVLVVGCGTAGSAAAVAAADGGASVLVIEKHDWPGGQMRRCAGGIAAAETQIQAALGVEDNVEDFYEFWIASMGERVDKDLVKKYCYNASSVIDWVIDDLGGEPVSEWTMVGDDNGLEYSLGPGLNMGAPFQYDELGFKPVQRCHWFAKNPDDEILQEDNLLKYVPSQTGGGTGLWKVFSAAMEDRGVEIKLETPIKRLITNAETGEVIGAIAENGGSDLRIKAKRGVVMAAGNFANNSEMFNNYIKQEWVAGAGGGLGLDLADDNDGAGIKAVMGVGGYIAYPDAIGYNQDAPEGASYAMGGVKVNTEAEVINAFGETIPRLYAAGLDAGGIIVGYYPICGASVGRGLFYGRIAGGNAAALDPWE